MTGLTGTWRLVRLALRRDRVALPAWILGMAGFLAATTAMFEASYSEHPELLGPDTRIVVENPGMRVLGLVTGESVGGYALHRDGLTLAVLAALMSVLVVVRHTRQAEELGRAELMASGVVGRDAPLVAAVVVAVAADVALAVALAAALVVAGQPTSGALVGGASIAVVGIAFAGVAAVTSQLASTARTAIGLSGAALGGSFALAALGNMTGTVDSAALRVTSAWSAWLSPIGWSQQMRPFGGNLWWPAGLALLTTSLLVGTAIGFVHRRDFGRGVLPDRRGSAHAGVTLSSPLGLVARLQRGALLGWLTGLVLFGLVFGALGEQIKDLTGAATEWYAAFGGEASLLGAYWASMMQMAGMAAGIYVVTLMLRLHGDEARGISESVFGTAVSRARWLAAYGMNAAAGATLLLLTFAVSMGATGGQVLGDTRALVLDLLGAAAVQLPAIGVLGAVVVVLVLVTPRWCVPLSWLLVIGSIFVGPLFGPSLDLPSWLVNLSPFSHVPNAPAVPVDAGPVVGLVGVSALLALVGVLAQRSRNLALPA